MENLVIEAVKITGTSPEWVGTLSQHIINIILTFNLWFWIIRFVKWSWNK